MKHSTNYLLGVEHARSARLEAFAFSGLALSGVVLMTVALINSLDFAQNREGVVEAWATAGQAPTELVRGAPDRDRTNVTRVDVTHVRKHPGPSAANTIIAPGPLGPLQCQVVSCTTLP